jgi:hypothetical protein
MLLCYHGNRITYYYALLIIELFYEICEMYILRQSRTYDTSYFSGSKFI